MEIKNVSMAEGYTARKLAGDASGNYQWGLRLRNILDSDWGSDTHGEKRLVVKNQWNDLAPHVNSKSLIELALVGKELELHMSESKSKYVFIIDSYSEVLKEIRQRSRNLPPLYKLKLKGLLHGEVLTSLKKNNLVSEHRINYLDLDFMNVGTDDVRKELGYTLRRVVRGPINKFLIVRPTFISAHRNGWTWTSKMNKMFEDIGFSQITSKNEISNDTEKLDLSHKITVDRDGWYDYQNKGSSTPMITSQFIYNAE